MYIILTDEKLNYTIIQNSPVLTLIVYSKFEKLKTKKKRSERKLVSDNLGWKIRYVKIEF